MVPALALAACVLPASTALAEQPRGVYIGVAIGDAEADATVGEMNQLFRDAARIQGATFIPGPATIDTKDSSLYLFGGYRIFPWLSAEGGYINLGGFEYNSRATLSGPGGIQSFNTHVEIQSQGVALSVLGNVPMSDWFEIHARLGFGILNTDADVTGTSSSRPIDVSESGISFAPQFGLGAAVNLGDHFSISADWVHFFEVDSGDDEDFEYDGYDVEVLRLSAIARF
jgi:hypothetical protein